jgi:hypothetical protein
VSNGDRPSPPTVLSCFFQKIRIAIGVTAPCGFKSPNKYALVMVSIISPVL